MKRLIIFCGVLICLAALPVFNGCENSAGKHYEYTLPEAQKPLPEPSEETLERSRVYTNDEYGFSFNYTEDFAPADNAEGKIVVLYGPLCEEMAYTIHIFLMAEQSDGRFTLADYAGIGRDSAAFNLPDFVLLDEYVTTVAGVPAVVQVDRYTHTVKDREMQLQEMIVSFMRGDTYYAMKYSCNREFFDEYAEAFYLALDTLTFSQN
jgi:hypothetical protein